MRCAVLGDPIAHSLSPALHRAGYAAVGLDWTYDAHRVAAGGLSEFVRGLDASWRGLSLTMPLKREALELASEASPIARLAGAANTLLLVDGALRPVPPAGMALLHTLARRPGWVVSRADLLRALPGNGTDEHAVETAMARLRTALGIPRLIQTVVKRGYRLALDPSADTKYDGVRTGG